MTSGFKRLAPVAGESLRGCCRGVCHSNGKMTAIRRRGRSISNRATYIHWYRLRRTEPLLYPITSSTYRTWPKHRIHSLAAMNAAACLHALPCGIIVQNSVFAHNAASQLFPLSHHRRHRCTTHGKLVPGRGREIITSRRTWSCPLSVVPPPVPSRSRQSCPRKPCPHSRCSALKPPRSHIPALLRGSCRRPSRLVVVRVADQIYWPRS